MTYLQPLKTFSRIILKFKKMHPPQFIFACLIFDKFWFSIKLNNPNWIQDGDLVKCITWLIFSKFCLMNF